MAGGELACQMGVELRVIRVGPHVVRTFGISDLCVRETERSRGLAARLLAEVTGLAQACEMDFVILFADDDRLYTRNGWARAANPCTWVKIDDHTTLGLAVAQDTGALMVKATGQQAGPTTTWTCSATCSDLRSRAVRSWVMARSASGESPLSACRGEHGRSSRAQYRRSLLPRWNYCHSGDRGCAE